MTFKFSTITKIIKSQKEKKDIVGFKTRTIKTRNALKTWKNSVSAYFLKFFSNKIVWNFSN